jgi:hypothetical protein
MAPYLKRLTCCGVPAPSTAAPWTFHQKDEAYHRGPHPSAATHYAAFLLEDMYDYVHRGYWIVLPYEAVRHLPHLKLAPSGVVPQRERRPWPIKDYSYNHVNQAALPVAPTQSMQFGWAFQRLLQRLAYCNPAYDPPFMAKLDLSDGYYRVPQTPQAALELVVLLPPDGTGDPIIGIPLSLPMGWSQSPPYFCAFTETCADLANAPPPPSPLPHPLYAATQCASTTVVEQFHPSAVLMTHQPYPSEPLRCVNVYIDDFMAVAQRPQQAPVMHRLLHCIDQVFRDDESSPRRQIISQSKLDKGDATWSTARRILGWDLDTATMTIRLPDHRLSRLKAAIQDLLPKRRTSRRKWFQFLGELRSMALAFHGARYLFSIFQHVLVDQHGPRIKLTPLVKQALLDWAELADTVHAYPVPITALVPGPPHYVMSVDASKAGMGGFWYPTSLTPDSQPCIWHAPFPSMVRDRLVTASNPQGDITNSDLELTAIVTGSTTLAANVDTPHLRITCATDNTPAHAWALKGSTSSTNPPAFLLRSLAQQCRAHQFTLFPRFTPGNTNSLADCCSRSFHLTDTAFLQHVQRLYPIQPPWQLVTPTTNFISQMNSALLKQMWPLASPSLDRPEPKQHGTFGPPFASTSNVTHTSPPSMTPSLCYKFSLNGTEWERWLPVGLQCDLKQWKTPFEPWARHWPHWAALTPASYRPGNLTYASNVSYKDTTKQILHLDKSNQCPYPSSRMQHNTAFAPTRLHPRPLRTCSYSASSSCSALANMLTPPTPTPAPFAYVTSISSSTIGT